MQSFLMASDIDLKRYELFGWDYESVASLSDEEVAWHEMWAKRTGGSLLGLACGTGRLLCRLAQKGFNVVGTDLSDAMLDLARRNLAELSPDVQSRVQFVKANMTTFSLGRNFNLIFIADNSFREQKTRADLLACLRCIRRHLAPAGRVLITERRFDLSPYCDSLRTFGWSTPVPHPQTGELVSRRGEIRLSKDRRRISGKFIYKTVREDGSEIIEKCPWSAPLLQKQEYLDLFGQAGFTVKTFIDYRKTPDDGNNPILCFVLKVSSSRTKSKVTGRQKEL